MTLTEKEFAKNVIKAYLLDYKSKNDDTYEFNSEKVDKMDDVILYCHKLEEQYGCKIIRCMIEPKYRQGYIQVLFKGELILEKAYGSLDEFSNAIKLCDGINIDTNPAGEDMFQITFFIEDLWIEKDNNNSAI